MGENMNFTEIANARQSCRSYDPSRDVEEEKLDRILKTAILSPSEIKEYSVIPFLKYDNIFCVVIE